ncbi:hypothetical protein BH11ACT7_BH11ACT7_39150 [soil metagenome]
MDSERSRTLWFGYDGFVERPAESRHAFAGGAVLGALPVLGALLGAVASGARDVPAVWLPAGFCAVMLLLVIVDESRLR